MGIEAIGGLTATGHERALLLKSVATSLMRAGAPREYAELLRDILTINHSQCSPPLSVDGVEDAVWDAVGPMPHTVPADRGRYVGNAFARKSVARAMDEVCGYQRRAAELVAESDGLRDELGKARDEAVSESNRRAVAEFNLAEMKAEVESLKVKAYDACRDVGESGRHQLAMLDKIGGLRLEVKRLQGELDAERALRANDAKLLTEAASALSKTNDEILRVRHGAFVSAGGSQAAMNMARQDAKGALAKYHDVCGKLKAERAKRIEVEAQLDKARKARDATGNARAKEAIELIGLRQGYDALVKSLGKPGEAKGEDGAKCRGHRDELVSLKKQLHDKDKTLGYVSSDRAAIFTKLKRTELSLAARCREMEVLRDDLKLAEANAEPTGSPGWDERSRTLKGVKLTRETWQAKRAEIESRAAYERRPSHRAAELLTKVVKAHAEASLGLIEHEREMWALVGEDWDEDGWL